MISKVNSIVPHGFGGALVEVEGSKTRSLSQFNIVGLASKTINESRERVRNAIRASGFTFPSSNRITINLAPAELNKDGPHLDLPIALSVMILSNQLRQEDVDDAIFVGELSLEGLLRPVRGIINVVEAAKNLNYKTVYLPIQNIPQASLVDNIKLIGIESLKQLILILKSQISPPANHLEESLNSPKCPSSAPTLDQIRGQERAKRALEIAVAGHHNLLLNGPPGAGKTMLARTATNLLPPMSRAEKISVTKIHGLSNSNCEIITSRPFRSPHHTASTVSINGGGNHACPGEISLAHLGVLYLDEFPEFPRSVLEALRQPLEDKIISISRANTKVTYPADFMLIATMNPCPCGHLGDPFHQCTCTPQQIETYKKRISGPLLDRIDIYLDVNPVETSSLLNPTTSSSTSIQDVVKNNITEAVERQFNRYHNKETRNSNLSSTEVANLLSLKPSAKTTLDIATKSLGLSARSYFKVIKVAQTIADLEGSSEISDSHISESLSFRKR